MIENLDVRKLPEVVPKIPEVVTSLPGAVAELPGVVTELPGVVPHIPYVSTGSYVVVVSERTFAIEAWKEVVDALRQKHNGAVVVYADSVWESLEPLARIQPRYACFVAQGDEVSRQFVVEIHRLTRQLDKDPYTDAIWGILTGYEAEDALRIAKHKTPLVARRALSATSSFLTAPFEEAVRYDEMAAGHRWVTRPQEAERQENAPADPTGAIAADFNKMPPDLVAASGNATSADWQLGYGYEAGSIRCSRGGLYGLDLAGQRYAIDSPNPKVFLPFGNPFIGHIPVRDSMALALIHSAGVYQMFGYTSMTFHGYMGWGIQDMFTAHGDRFTFAEVFFFNNQALVHRLETEYPNAARVDFEFYHPKATRWLANRHSLRSDDELGLLWDRDIVAFYGDPAWEVRLLPHDPAWTYHFQVKQDSITERMDDLTEKTATYTFQITTQRAGDWGKRPVVALLPHRLADVYVATNSRATPVVTDNFILVALAGAFQKGEKFEFSFRAKRIAENQTSAWTAPIRASELHGDDTKNLSAEEIAILAALPEPYRKRVALALQRVDRNRPEIFLALAGADKKDRESIAFLVAYMPKQDLASLSASYLLENAQLAREARERAAWAKDVPDAIFLNDVLPYACLTESRGRWRADLLKRLAPLVGEANSISQAALALRAGLYETLGVRREPDDSQNPDASPSETIRARAASQTGQAILLANACRALGVPARVVGTPAWTGREGYGMWVEIWDGQWHALGPSDSGALDALPFADDVAKADAREPLNCVYAASFHETPLHFPLIWQLDEQSVHARNVTTRYASPVDVQLALEKESGDKAQVSEIDLRLDGEYYARLRTDASGTAPRLKLPPDRRFDAEVRLSNDKSLTRAFRTGFEPSETIELSVKQ